MEDCLGIDAIPGVCLVENDVQRRVAGTIDKFQALEGFLIDDDGHPRHEHEDGRDRNGAVVSVTEHRKRFLRRLAVFPLVFGHENPE